MTTSVLRLLQGGALSCPGEGGGFDMKYYCEKHMPKFKQKLGSASKTIALKQAIARAAAGLSPPYVAQKI